MPKYCCGMAADGRFGSEFPSCSSSSSSSISGYGSLRFRAETPESDYGETSSAYYSAGSETSRQRLKSAISEASIDSFFKEGPQFYDLDSIDLGRLSPEVQIEPDPESLDTVRPSAELARQEVSSMARAILDLIDQMRLDSSPKLSSIPEDHIYEQIPFDSTTVNKKALAPPPLPERNKFNESKRSNELNKQVFPLALRKKKKPTRFHNFSHSLDGLSDSPSTDCTRL